MLFFLLLLGCVTVLLWGVPQYRRSRNRNLIALRASGTGCLSLVLLLVVGFLLLLILRLPLSILPLFLIAFCTLPLIAGVFAAFLAVKISRRVGLEGPPPSVRAILCYFLLGLVGVTIWGGGRCLEMRRVKETWAVEYAVPMAGIRKIAVCQRLLNPVFERYEGTLKVVGADGSTRTLAFPPDRMDGRRVVNLYGLTKVPDLQQPLFLFADGVSAYLADPVAMRILPVERNGKVLRIGGKEIPAGEFFRQAEYLGVFRGAEFRDSTRAPELPLRGMYGEEKRTPDPNPDPALSLPTKNSPGK